MNFSIDDLKLIRQQRKTMLRRPVKAGEKDCVFREKRAYWAAQAGRAGEFKITVQSVHQERLGEVSHKDARREGFATTDEFLDAWKAKRPRAKPNDLVWVILFVVGDFSDEPRLLAANPGASRTDYVTNRFRAARDEPEAIGAGEQEVMSRMARERDSDRSKHPDKALRDGLVRELEKWREQSGGVTDRDRRDAIRGIERQLATLDRKLKAA